MVNSNARSNLGPFVMGVLFIALGVLFLVGDLGFLWRWSFWEVFPPFILILLGVSRLTEPGRERAGGWLLLVGSLLLAHNLRVLTFRQSWRISAAISYRGRDIRGVYSLPFPAYRRATEAPMLQSEEDFIEQFARHPLGDLHTFAGFDRIRAWEQEYLGEEAMKKYADSVGHLPRGG